VSHTVIARVVRSGFVESLHHGTAVAVDADGDIVATAGAPGALIYPRSSAKPLQAVAMLRAGLPLDGALLALTAASHSGERFHLDGARRILDGAGLDPTHLQNPPDLPYDEAERIGWRLAGRRPSPLAHNCSGKHAAMLATCVENGWPTATYLQPGHPLQQLLAETTADLAGEPVAATGVDGCGAPVHAISVLGLAAAFARIATAPSGSPEGRVATALRRYPEWLGGTGRDVTVLMRSVPGIIAKDGAEAVYAAAMPDGRAAALKVADGGQRVRPLVMAALLRRLGVGAPALDELATVPVLGGEVPVGIIEAVGI
jgi:L-asparaginase II